MSRLSSSLTTVLGFGLVALGACSNPADPPVVDNSGSTGVPSGVDVSTEATQTAQRGTSSTAVAQSKSVSELFVQEDPTIDPSLTAVENAEAVAKQVAASLEAADKCAAATVNHTSGAVTVSVDFGTGCSFPAVGLTVSGEASASISKSGDTVTVDFVFTHLVANGLSLDGTASEATTSGTSYSWDVAVTADGDPVSFVGTAVPDSDRKGLTFSGHGTFGPGDTIHSQSSDVHVTFGACYPDAGTISFTKDDVVHGVTVALTEVITFESTTPTTGEAMISIDGVSSTETLPAYGSCS